MTTIAFAQVRAGHLTIETVLSVKRMRENTEELTR
jgi:hypothetical protein